MRPAQRRSRGLEYGIVLLIMQVLNYGIDKIPPATLFGVVAQALIYTRLIKFDWTVESICISSLKTFKYHDFRSFFISNFEHGSDMHLYYNMISFIFKGSFLEPLYGTTNFAVLIVILSAMCSAMYVSLGYVLLQITGDYSYFTACAVGFSAVLFALKVIVTCEENDRTVDDGTIQTGKFTCWMELILIHFLVPNTSLVGHLGGILVGCLYCYTFVGEMIDDKIQWISGRPIIHEEAFYRRRSYIRI